nr:MAG TPA_asm: hypothetical protein [Caudoviricetes sp.]
MLNNHTEQDGEPTPQVGTVGVHQYPPAHAKHIILGVRELCGKRTCEKYRNQVCKGKKAR